MLGAMQTVTRVQGGTHFTGNNSVSKMTRSYLCGILAKTLNAICPKIMPEFKIKSNDLNPLTKANSRQHNIKSLVCFL